MNAKYDKDTSEGYEKYGFPWHHHVVRTIMSFLENKSGVVTSDGRKFDLMLDAGCGGGKSTRVFAQFFKATVGFDKSEACIQLARKTADPQSVSYVLANGEDMPAEDESVDLLTSAFAVHLMNLSMFVNECRRIMKPHGCAALYGYEHMDIRNVALGENSPSGIALWRQYFIDPLRQHLLQIGDQTETCHNRYETLFSKVEGMNKTRDDSVKFAIDLSLNDFVGLYRIVPQPASFFQGLDSDPLDKFAEEVKSLWGISNHKNESVLIRVKYSVFIIFLTK